METNSSISFAGQVPWPQSEPAEGAGSVQQRKCSCTTSPRRTSSSVKSLSLESPTSPCLDAGWSLPIPQPLCSGTKRVMSGSGSFSWLKQLSLLLHQLRKPPVLYWQCCQHWMDGHPSIFPCVTLPVTTVLVFNSFWWGVGGAWAALFALSKHRRLTLQHLWLSLPGWQDLHLPSSPTPP